ncbi:MAG: GTP cyclohydrolase II [Alphaproteobacteria bacterium]|nr:GTP cyclohydrolase II [Alphaproteobacteria bacterium]
MTAAAMPEPRVDSPVAVERAVAEFRRGRPVMLLTPAGSGLAAAAELVTPVRLAWFARETGQALLALTAGRAAALRIPPSGHATLLVELTPWLDAASIAALADATTDLAAPLRGPFQRQKRPPEPWETAALGLAKLARLLPAALVGRLPADQPSDFARQHDLLAVTAAAIARYEQGAALRLRQVAGARVPLQAAEDCQILAFRPEDGGIEHLAIVVGAPDRRQPVLVRLHSECFTGDLLGSLKCDCGEQLRGALAAMAAPQGGIVLYLAQEGRGIGLMNKLRAYRLQEDGFDTIEANLRLGFDADERLFQPAAEMLRQLGVARIRLLTNNPDKVAGLTALGIEVVERVPHDFPANRHNEGYLLAKRHKAGHLF